MTHIEKHIICLLKTKIDRATVQVSLQMETLIFRFIMFQAFQKMYLLANLDK